MSRLSPKEKKFALYLAEGDTVPDAYTRAFGKRCDPYTPEYKRASNLSRTKRVQAARDEAIEKLEKRNEMRTLADDHLPTQWENIYQFVYERLKAIRNDRETSPRTRLMAIETLEKISDPTQDTNLIWRFVNTVWNGLTAHCPACHESFPLWRIKNERLYKWRMQNQVFKIPKPKEEIERRLYLISQGSKRERPEEHQSQMTILSAPERSIVGVGPARTGKSRCLAFLGFMQLLVPGSNIWLLARTYDRAKHEFDYIIRSLTEAFYPIGQHVFDITYDKKTGEAKIETRWGSYIEIKSSQSKGAITGEELELILIAEPAWVDADLFEEVRARMSSRLGRIIALGTDKEMGAGGFLKRMIQMGERDMRTGERLPANSRTIDAGCRWSQSLFRTRLYPKDNPAYVLSELESARTELTAEEYASEFEGEIVRGTNLKFPHITEEHRYRISPHDLAMSSFVLGVDQGEKNFAAVLIGWDGETIRFIDEYFDSSSTTIKANLIKLQYATPTALKMRGCDIDRWKLTCFDADPVVSNQLEEMENEGRAWPTDITLRPKGKNTMATWREETCQWLNEMAKDNRVVFDGEKCDQLHEQFLEVLRKPEGPDESPAKKKWIVTDRWREDHVLDAAMHGLWTIYSSSLSVIPEKHKVHSPVEEHKRAFEYRLKLQERRELGYKIDEEDLFRETFGRSPLHEGGMPTGLPGYYPDES